MSWGDNPIKGTAPKREHAFIEMSGPGKVKKFAPFSDVYYNITIHTKNGWSDPCEMWCHSVTKNGNWFGNFFSRNRSREDKSCPFGKANELQLQNANGMTIENKQRVYPLSLQKCVLISIDELPLVPWLLWTFSDKEFKKIKASFDMGNANPITHKLKLFRSGKGKEGVSYSYGVGDPVDPQIIQNIDIPPITPDTFKELLISFEDPFKPELGLFQAANNGFETQQTPNQNANNQFTNQTTGNQLENNQNGTLTNTQPDTASAQPGTKTVPQEKPANVIEAENEVINYGTLINKKLGELDDKVLGVIVTQLMGKVQEHASTILEYRKTLNVSADQVPF